MNELSQNVLFHFRDYLFLAHVLVDSGSILIINNHKSLKAQYDKKTENKIDKAKANEKHLFNDRFDNMFSI